MAKCDQDKDKKDETLTIITKEKSLKKKEKAVGMVEDIRGGLGYKFQSGERRKSRDGKILRKKEKEKILRAKLVKIEFFLKEACHIIFERRWWIILFAGIFLVILSVRIQ